MILSDDTIRELMANGELILDGNPENARYGSYRFTAAKLYHGGQDGKVVDFSQVTAPHEDVIKPGEYVWVRMAEQVCLPLNLTAFWWQTNNLSRKGLVLMNMSIVEPGYKGPLSCLFVNFSQLPISINIGQPLAKLVFMKLDRDSVSPFRNNQRSGITFDEYDHEIHTEALQRPTTFLQVTEEVTKQFGLLEQKRIEAIKDIEEENKKLLEENKKAFEQNIPSAIRKSVALAASALAFLIIVSAATPWIQSLFRNDLDKYVIGAVRSEFANRVLFQGTVASEQAEHQQRELLQKLEVLEVRLKALENPKKP